jgi:hypothetical protein
MTDNELLEAILKELRELRDAGKVLAWLVGGIAGVCVVWLLRG